MDVLSQQLTRHLLTGCGSGLRALQLYDETLVDVQVEIRAACTMACQRNLVSELNSWPFDECYLPCPSDLRCESARCAA